MLERARDCRCLWVSLVRIFELGHPFFNSSSVVCQQFQTAKGWKRAPLSRFLFTSLDLFLVGCLWELSRKCAQPPVGNLHEYSNSRVDLLRLSNMIVFSFGEIVAGKQLRSRKRPRRLDEIESGALLLDRRLIAFR